MILIHIPEQFKIDDKFFRGSINEFAMFIHIQSAYPYEKIERIDLKVPVNCFGEICVPTYFKNQGLVNLRVRIFPSQEL